MHYVSDSELGYMASARRFFPAEALRFDEAYRRAYLPLINPGHPAVIAASGGYELGRYSQRRYSLVLPVAMDALESSTVFSDLDREFRQSSFAGAIAWEAMAQRRSLVHVTLCRGFSEQALPALTDKLNTWVKHTRRPGYRVGGPFAGTINTGRIYFKIYPEKREGRNLFHTLQGRVDGQTTHLWLAGYYHFQDEPDALQTAHLASVIEKYADETLFTATARELWLLASNDDLGISGEVMYRFLFAE